MRQSKVDQDGFARGAKHDAARLHVVMDHVLPMQIGQRRRDFPGDDPRLLVTERQIAKSAIERFARNPFHNHIGLTCKIAGRVAGRHVRP